MVIDERTVKAERARRDGYIILGVDEKPIRLGNLIEFVQDIFPNHSLDQLAITQAEEDQFVVAAETHIMTRAN